MPSQVITSTENNFTKGLVTEFTGLNFPENAATDAINSEFTIVGDVVRRLGINYEENVVQAPINRVNGAIAAYKWNNAGGDGNTQIVVEQIGGILHFYKSSAAIVASPLSAQLLLSTVDMSLFASGSFDNTVECQFADGNGYLFVYNPTCDPIFCTLDPFTNIITPAVIKINIRDFAGYSETGIPTTFRPPTPSISLQHEYNLKNQGWSIAPTWSTQSASTNQNIAIGQPFVLFGVGSGLPATPGDSVNITGGFDVQIKGASVFFPWSVQGVVTSYSGTTLTITTGSFTGNTFSGTVIQEIWYVNEGAGNNYITTWTSGVGNFPSNADVWWEFKDNTDVFNPTATIANVTLSSPAPKGSFVLEAFNQQQSVVSSIAGLGSFVTQVRPKTGTWFAGRIWYAGADASINNGGPDQNLPYTWTENIYFSQITTDNTQFGNCYQVNDPTNENLFDLLPTDGGVIQIQGCGSVYKLFPIQNGMLVFAANGVWFITGSQGIGFAANDYTITKISNVVSISSTSFVNVMGLPYFWNEEGIYAVEPQQGGGLAVNPLTVGTILTYYNAIPYDSKKYAHGDYDPINYVIQWVYKSTQETSVTDRYTYDTILNFNTYNKAFFPYSVDHTVNSINGIIYVSNPGGTNAPDPVFKYIASLVTAGGASGTIAFAEEYDESLVDWGSINYISDFTTGYKLHGQGLKRFQLSYLYVYSRGGPTSYKVQGLWDYAVSGNSGRWSVAQLINNWNPNFGSIFRRHKIRGQGLVLQLKFTSVDGQPFDIMGWAAFENMNTGV